MRTLSLATLALLAATVSTGCDSARSVRDAPADANAWGCDQCHGYPPPPFLTSATEHPEGVTSAMCTVCHSSTVQADGHTIVPGGTHRNGQIEAVLDVTTVACDSCHGTPPDSGLHATHVARLVSSEGLTTGQSCGVCHAGFLAGDDAATRAQDATVHMNGQADVILPDANHTVVTTYRRADGVWPTSECKQCHDALGVGEAVQ